MFAKPRSINLAGDGILQIILNGLERSIPADLMSDERQLLKGLQQLDPEAITEIHQRFYSNVFRYARYRLGDHALAEDIAAETFIRLLDAVHAGKGPRTSLRGWLMGTTSNLINDYFRTHYSRPTQTLNEQIKAQHGNPTQFVEQTARDQALRLALQVLPKSQQHVLALRFGSGCSLAETAKIMGKKPNAIKQLQFRALTRLRQELGGYFDD